GIASSIGLLWNLWREIPKAYRIFVAMPALPQLQSAPDEVFDNRTINFRLFWWMRKNGNIHAVAPRWGLPRKKGEPPDETNLDTIDAASRRGVHSDQLLLEYMSARE